MFFSSYFVLNRLRRKSLISYPGLALLFLGLFNWGWTAYGFHRWFHASTNYFKCPSFTAVVFGGNIAFTTLLSLPFFWILFWMIFIKGTSALVGVISPPVLIWIKKKRAGL